MTWAYLWPLLQLYPKVAFPPREDPSCRSQQPDHWSKEIRLFLGIFGSKKWWKFRRKKLAAATPLQQKLPRGDCMCISKISATNVFISLSWTWRYCWWKKSGQPVEVGSLSYQSFIYPRWCRISSITRITNFCRDLYNSTFAEAL